MGTAIGTGRRARKPIMAEVDGQQKASDACGGRLSHERGWRTRGQDVPGPINCTRRSPSSFSPLPRPHALPSLVVASLSIFLSRFRFFSFVGTAVFLAAAFLRSSVPNRLPPSLNRVSQSGAREIISRFVTYIDLYFTPLTYYRSSPFALRSTSAILLSQ